MEGFSNWDREEPFEPFTVMLFKGLQVVAFMFFLAYLAINTDAKQGKVDTKAEMLVTVSWPDNHPDDIDTYVEDPQGNIVWVHERGSAETENGSVVRQRGLLRRLDSGRRCRRWRCRRCRWRRGRCLGRGGGLSRCRRRHPAR